MVEPLYLESLHFLLAHGNVNGEEVLYHMDSGLADVSSVRLHTQAIEYLGLPIPETNYTTTALGGGGSGFEEGRFDLGSVGIDRFVKIDVRSYYTPGSDSGYTRSGFFVEGILSHTYLKDYAWTLDFRNMNMVLTRP
jgi:hypothetical protein